MKSSIPHSPKSIWPRTSLPQGWVLASLPDLLSLDIGFAFKSAEYVTTGVRLLRGENIEPGRLRWEDTKHWSEAKSSELKHLCIKEGDIILAMDRPLVSAGLKIARAKRSDLPCLLVQRMARFCLFDAEMTAFVYQALTTDVFIRHLFEGQTGTQLPHISGKRILDFEIPLPPVAEQQRIVATLDERLSKLDDSVANLERAERNLVRYRAAVLAAACSGKLVPTEADLVRRAGRSYESADQLLVRILVERRKANTKAKYDEPTKPDTSKLLKLPEGWAWATVDQLTADQSYGSSAKTGESPDGIPVLRMGNIQDGKLDITKLKYLPRNHSEFPDLFLHNNDLLFNRTNSAELVGKAAVYQGQPSPCSYASYLIRVRFAPSVFPHYVCGVINSAYGRAWIRSVMHQQVGQANVNGTKLAAFLVPLPPLAEQERIVAEVDRHLSRADALASSIAQAKRRAQRLRRAILAAAFQGRLVPQDPNDEPASVLLDRIRTQVANAEVTTTSTQRRGRPLAPARVAEATTTYAAPATKRRGRPPGAKDKAKA